MASIHKIKLTTALTKAQLQGHLSGLEQGNPKVAAHQIAQYIKACSAGSREGSIVVNIGAIQAAATVTSTGAMTNGDTFTLLSQTITGATSGNGTTSFTVSATIATQATNLATCINANAVTSLYVTAAASAGVVTITSNEPGIVGNALQIADVTTANTTIAAFTGGSAGTATTLDFS